MSLRQLPLPTFQSVAANQDALCHIPSGRDLHAIWLEISDAAGTTLNSGNLIGDVQVITASATQRQVTGVQLNHIQSINDSDCAAKTVGVAGQAGYKTMLPIFFAEPWRKLPAEIRASAWGLNGVDGLDLKVRVGNLNNPVITGWYEFEPSNRPLGSIVKYLRKTYPAIGSIVEDSKVEARDLIQAMHFFPTSDGKYVDHLKFTKDGEFYREEITYLRNQASLLARGLNPDTNAAPAYDLVFDYDDPITSWLVAQGSRDLSFRADLNAAAAGTMDVVTVRVGPPQ